MECTDGMLEARMSGTGINDGGQSQLVDACEALHQRMTYDIKQETLGYFDKSKYRIVDYLGVVHLCLSSSTAISC